jgi:hypothetical protein
MRTRILLLAVVGVTFALAAAPARAAILYGLADNGSGQGLLRFNSSSPNSPDPFIPFTGVQSGELIQGIDFRPSDGQLFAIGRANASSTLYTVNPATGAATIVAPISMPLSGNSFGMDFDPAIDRIRVVSDADQNLVINPATGAATAGSPLMYMGGSPNPFISGLANSGGTLFGIDSGTNYLVVVDPSTGLVTNRGPLGVPPGPLLGMDDVDDILFFAAGNHLHTVNKSTGNAPSAGDLPMNFLVTGLAGQSSSGGTPGTPGTPGAPGGPDGNGLPGDFDLNGSVDAADYIVWRKATLNQDGLTVTIRTPNGVRVGSETDLYNEWRANFGRVGGSRHASAAQRPKAIRFARNRTTLRGQDSKRVRIRLTKAGRRAVRRYARRRLRATLTLRVTYRPAIGAAPQTRTFKQKVTLRVKRKRR